MKIKWNTRTRMKVFILASVFAGYLMWYVVTQYPRLGYQADIGGIVKAIGWVWFGAFATVVLGIAGEKVWGKPENLYPDYYQENYRGGVNHYSPVQIPQPAPEEVRPDV